MVFDLGARLKEVRLSAGLSQRKLAERADVPHGLISIVEQNKSSPSVATLRKILGGVPTTLSDFFQEKVSSSEQVFFRRDEFVHLTDRITGGGNGRSAEIQISQVGNAASANLQLLHERFEPGADTGSTMFQHEAHEGGFILRGTLELTVGDKVGVLTAGDAFLFDSRVPHRYRNTGDDVLEFVVACTPPFL